jgi:hypothetical protein
LILCNLAKCGQGLDTWSSGPRKRARKLPRKASIFIFEFEPLTLKGVGASRWAEEFEFKLPCLEPTRENAEVLTPLLHT